MLFTLSVAKGLSETEYHDLKLKKGKHRVRVTPFLKGTITNFKVSAFIRSNF